jgi:hypothetical protein
MSKRYISIVIFVLVTFVNLGILFFRNSFSYQPNASYNSLYKPCDQSCRDNWQKFMSPYPEEETAAANKLMDSVITNSNKSTREKIGIIGTFLYKRFHDQEGKPSAALLSATPFSQFEYLGAHRSEKLWCGNFSEMFTFFCWSQNIPSRVVEIMNEGDHHVLSECYVSEDNRWVMVDVSGNFILVTDGNNSDLNLIQFKRSLVNRDPLYANSVAGDSVVKIPIDKNADYIARYYKKETPIYFYHEVELNDVYSTFSKIKRYFLPVSWYDSYSMDRQFNLLFYVKQFFVLLWLVTLGRVAMEVRVGEKFDH